MRYNGQIGRVALSIEHPILSDIHRAASGTIQKRSSRNEVRVAALSEFIRKLRCRMKVALLAATAIAVVGFTVSARADTAQHLQMTSAGRLLAQIDMLDDNLCAAFRGQMQERFRAGLAATCGTPIKGLEFHALLRMAGTPRDSDAYFPSQEACDGFTLAISRGSFATVVDRCQHR